MIAAFERKLCGFASSISISATSLAAAEIRATQHRRQTPTPAEQVLERTANKNMKP